MVKYDAARKGAHLSVPPTTFRIHQRLQPRRKRRIAPQPGEPNPQPARARVVFYLQHVACTVYVIQCHGSEGHSPDQGCMHCMKSIPPGRQSERFSVSRAAKARP